MSMPLTTVLSALLQEGRFTGSFHVDLALCTSTIMTVQPAFLNHETEADNALVRALVDCLGFLTPDDFWDREKRHETETDYKNAVIAASALICNGGICYGSAKCMLAETGPNSGALAIVPPNEGSDVAFTIEPLTSKPRSCPDPSLN